MCSILSIQQTRLTRLVEGSRKLICLFAASLLLAVWPVATVAADLEEQDQKYFDIPQQRADLSLTRFAEQADITLIFTFELARDKTTNRLIGTYSPREAIELLLRDTGLKPTFSNDGYINIAPAKSPVAEGDDMLNKKQTGVLAVLTALFTAPIADAQSEGDDAVEEIVVVGIRQALNDAVADKRNALQVLDSLSLGDLGELPTISIADSLEFLPGVSGTRFRGNVDEISLRGLPQIFAQSTVNGRELTSGDGGRFVRYRIWPSNFFDKALVSKSPLPDQVEGGIAGTIDLQTLSALDYKGPVLNLDARVQESPFNDNNDLIDNRGARANARFTRSIETGSGEAGLVLSLDYMDNPITIGQAFLPAFSRRTILGEQAVVPNLALFSNDTEHFERIAGLGVFEWRSDDGTELKIDAVVTRVENPQERTFLQINNLNTPNRYVDAVIEGGALQSGTLQNLLVLSRFEDLDRIDDAYMIGANLKKEFGTWRAQVDGFMSRTEVDFQLVRPLFRATGVGADFEFTGGDLLFSNFSRDLTDQSIWGAHQLFAFDRQIEDTTQGIRVDFDRDLSGFFSGLAFGTRYSERSMERLELRSNDTSVRNAALYPELAIGALDPSLFADPYIEFDLRGDTRGALPTPFAVFNRSAVHAALPPPVFDPNNSADLLNRFVDNVEENWAVYLRADFASELGGKPVTGALGVRVVNTELTASGFSGEPVAVTDPDTGAVTIEVPGDLVPARETNDYTEVLPSLNVKIDLSDEWVLRAGIARTMARPDFLDLRLAQNLSGGDIDSQPFSGSAGNPGLDPIISDQVDVSLEWYPREGTALTGTIYHKNVSGFVVTDVRAAEIGGYAYELSSPINADDGDFTGLELSVRHDFDYLPAPFDGLGVLLNATFNDSTLDPEYGVLTDTDAATGEFLFDVKDRDPGVEGFAERTAAGLIFYQKGRVSIRASARYLSDRVRNVASLNAPIVSESYTRYDFAASVRVTDNIRLQFQALNLTEESTDGYYAFNNYTAVNQQIGRTYFLGASLRL